MTPRAPKKNRMIRVEDSTWAAAKRQADAGETRRVTVHLTGSETVSEAIRKFLEAWAR